MKAVLSTFARTPFHLAGKGAFADVRPDALPRVMDPPSVIPWEPLVHGSRERRHLLQRSRGRLALSAQCIGGGAGHCNDSRGDLGYPIHARLEHEH